MRHSILQNSCNLLFASSSNSDLLYVSYKTYLFNICLLSLMLVNLFWQSRWILSLERTNLLSHFHTRIQNKRKKKKRCRFESALSCFPHQNFYYGTSVNCYLPMVVVNKIYIAYRET